MNDQEKGYELLHKYMQEVANELERTFIYCVTGSLRDGKYVHGKSDIDICVMPEHGVMSPVAFIWMNNYGKKFGEVFKKGRMIPLFDVLIPTHSRMIKSFRNSMIDLEKQGKVKLYTVKPLEVINEDSQTCV